jgi:hypothetical protein
MIKSYVKDLSIKQVNWFVAAISGLDMSTDRFVETFQDGFYYSLAGCPTPIPNYVNGYSEVFQNILDQCKIDIRYTNSVCYASKSMSGGRFLIQEGRTAREAAYRWLINLHYGEMVVLPKALDMPEPVMEVHQPECT